VMKAPEAERQEDWTEILQALHDAATELPFAGKRIPAVINNRLHGFRTGLQQYDYPLHTLRVGKGSTTATVSPGGQTGLFAGVGRLDPHTYRPNEFFASNMVYEGLVEYGQDGVILPSLAESWTVEADGAGMKYTFTLREGVKFHDGSAWDCSVAKLNFDHVLAPPLTTGDWHGWYKLPEQINGWTCKSDFVFEVTTKDNYYPLLQELTYIRPLRMLSPAMFVGGADSDPLTQNSCHVGWGEATLGDVTVTCAGVTGISGTGRWVYDTTEADETVVFKLNAEHWDSSPADAVQVLRLVKYADHAAVKAAVMDGTLDVVIGAGPLDPEDIEDMMTNHKDKVTVSMTEAIQNRIIIFNTAKAPTDDIQMRKVIIHAINKAAIIAKELHGLAEPVDGLFPKTAPYCNLALTPRWDYDIEKAELLICPDLAIETAVSDSKAEAKAEREARLAAEKAESDEKEARLAAEKAESDGKKELDAALADLAAAQKKVDDLEAKAEESGAELPGVLGLIMIVAGRL